MRNSKRKRDESIQVEINESFNSGLGLYSQANYRILSQFPVGPRMPKVSLGLVSFALSGDFSKKNEPNSSDSYYWHLSCNEYWRNYCEFFLKTTRQIAQSKKLHIIAFNEYAFPSFLPQRKYPKYNHESIRDAIQKIAQKNNILIFPGTLNVVDNSLSDIYGCSIGYLFSPADEPYIVRKSIHARSLKKGKPLEGFKKPSTQRDLFIFRSMGGNLAISICSDFINGCETQLFDDYLTSNSDPRRPHKELSLLIVPGRDSSKHVDQYSLELSKRVYYPVAYVNSLEYYGISTDDSSKVFHRGQIIKARKKDCEMFKAKGFKAFLKIYNIDFLLPQRMRFENKAIMPPDIRSK